MVPNKSLNFWGSESTLADSKTSKAIRVNTLLADSHYLVFLQSISNLTIYWLSSVGCKDSKISWPIVCLSQNVHARIKPHHKAGCPPPSRKKCFVTVGIKEMAYHTKIVVVTGCKIRYLQNTISCKLSNLFSQISTTELN